MTANPDLGRFLFALLLWGIGFFLQYFGQRGWIAPQWLKYFLGVWKKDQRVSFVGAIWQLWGLEAFIFLRPVFFDVIPEGFGSFIFLGASFFANIFILKRLLREDKDNRKVGSNTMKNLERFLACFSHKITGSCPRISENTLRLCASAVISFLLAFVIALPVLAQAPIDDNTLDVAKKLNCPTCGGRNLADCPTDTCNQWKQEIASQLAAGKSQAQVISYFQDRFGVTVMQEPPKSGQTLLLWLVPALAFVAFAILGVMALRRASARAQVAPSAGPSPTPPPSDDPYAQQIEDEAK